MRNKTSLAEAMSKTKSKDLNKIGVELLQFHQKPIINLRN